MFHVKQSSQKSIVTCFANQADNNEQKHFSDKPSTVFDSEMGSKQRPAYTANRH
jgi:hypothetical protein